MNKLKNLIPSIRPLNKSLWFSAFLLTTSALSFQAKAAVIAYDDFNYTPAANLNGQNGGTGFAGSWLTGDIYTTVSTGSLAYSGTAALPSAGNSAQVSPPDSFNYPGGTRYFLPVTSGDLWVSFRFSTSDSTKGYATLRLLNDGNQEATAGDQGDSTEFEAQDARGGTVVSGQVYFLTLQVQNIGGGAGNSTINLFLNDNLTTPFLTDSNETVASINSLDIVAGPSGYGNGSGGQTAKFDEIRVGTTLSDVTAVPEPSTWVFLSVGAGLMFLMVRRTWKVV